MEITTLTPLECAKRIFYVVKGREPKKGDVLNLGISKEFIEVCKILGEFSEEQEFQKIVNGKTWKAKEETQEYE